MNTRLPLIEGQRPRVVLIAGPTASGKSDIALALAKLLPATIINADASQVYRDLRILSARPSITDEAQAPHKLFGHIDGAQACSAADWACEAKVAIAEAIATERLPILVGGTGLYLRTLLDGIAPVPEIDPTIRTEVRRLDVSLAYAALLREDAEAAARLMPSDRTRIARALEVIRSTGRSLKDWQAQSVGGIVDQIDLVPLILLPPRDWLYTRCDARFAMMLERGGMHEVEALLARNLDPALPVMRAIGVREVSAILANPGNTVQQVTLAQIATRQYAKRQFTWFRNQFPSAWLRAECEINNDMINKLAIKLRHIALTQRFISLERPVLDKCAAPQQSGAWTNKEDEIMTAEQSGADILIAALCDLGVEVIFGYPGGAVLPIYDAIFKQKRIKHILVRHEQAATHAAEGYARSTGKPGVVLVTSGPGATNAVTGITDALMDSIPMVVITGQVATHLIGSDAFQEADTVGITRHCTKHNYLVKSPDTLGDIIHEAFHIATSGRPGPVVIDIPKDVQVATARYRKPGPINHKSYRPQIKPDISLIEAAVEMIAAAERPILYTGGGIINSGPGAAQILRELARITGAPVTSTLMGLGAYPASGESWLGMLGMHGTYEANWAMNQADLIVCLGARFDDRITGRLDAFSPKSKKIHFDIDRSSINKTVRVDLAVVGDVGRAMEDMIKIWKSRQHQKPDLSAWWKRIDEWRAKKSLSFPESKTEIMPQAAVRALWAATHKQNPIITTEVGQHQMWAAQHFDFESPNKWLTSGGLGTMGYGLPAAIGAQLGNPNALVIDIAGEASIQMNIQELATATQYRLPVKIFILNNEYMGMVRQWQELTYSSRYSESYSDSLPDFVKLGEAYDWKGIRIEHPDDLESGIKAMLDHDGPVIVDCMVAKLANCFPMIPSGASHVEMMLGDDNVSGEMSDEAKALV